jgi:hypothetical protein
MIDESIYSNQFQALIEVIKVWVWKNQRNWFPFLKIKDIKWFSNGKYTQLLAKAVIVVREKPVDD